MPSIGTSQYRQLIKWLIDINHHNALNSYQLMTIIKILDVFI